MAPPLGYPKQKSFQLQGAKASGASPPDPRPGALPPPPDPRAFPQLQICHYTTGRGPCDRLGLFRVLELFEHFEVKNATALFSAVLENL